MSALALIFTQKGFRVLGSDRAHDQGHSPEKFRALESAGIKIFPQDGSGVTSDIDALIISSAVEDSTPDIRVAMEKNIRIRKRADLLAEIFNDSPTGISVAGTSGKSTVTGMIATVLTQTGYDPTVMNGGIIRNFKTNMRVGQGGIFVTETDESDGSIALYNPSIAVLNNIALDHKSIDELDALFGDFIARAKKAVILNFDDTRLKKMQSRASARIFSYAINDKSADLVANDIKFLPGGVNFTVSGHAVHLHQPGMHNIWNALACLSVASALGIKLSDAIAALESFRGIGRRLEVVGTANGITIIDDFAHNPDKISATLATLKEFNGRVIIIFQPHGFGPLKLMGRQIADSFIKYMDKDDLLFMPEAYYAGGTVDRSVTAKDVIKFVSDAGKQAQWFQERAEILPRTLTDARPGDRIVIMGARDDTLSDFAKEILDSLSASRSASR